MGWQSVQAHYSNHYPEAVKVAIRDLEQGMTQQIISNKIHPFFVQVPAGAIVPPSSEGHNYQGVLANGHWVDASNLKPGYRLLNNDGSWAEVAHVTIEDRPLHAYNMTIANDHTYFVRGAPTPSDQPLAVPLAANDNQAIWVHNDCFDDAFDSLEGLIKDTNLTQEEFKALAGKWDKASSSTLAESLEYHYTKHSEGMTDFANYLRSAASFSRKNVKGRLRSDGSKIYQKNGFFAIYRGDKIVSYGKNNKK